MEILIGEVDFYPGHGRTRAGQEDIQVEATAWKNGKGGHRPETSYRRDQKAILSCEKLRSI